MTLVQNKAGGEYYEGKGYIKQTSDGILVYKMYITQSEHASPFGHLDTILNRVDTMHGGSMTYQFSAETYDGTKITAAGIIPNIS